MEKITKKEIIQVANVMGISLLPIQVELIQKGFGGKLTFVPIRGGRRITSLRDTIKELLKKKGDIKECVE